MKRDLHVVLNYQHVTLTCAMGSQWPRKSFSIFHKTVNDRKDNAAVKRKIKSKPGSD